MLEATALGKAYDGRVAVRGVDLALRPGRVVGLVGANGAGKTTTIKMLAGLTSPSEGRVTLEGRPTEDAATRARIGYLPEESPLYDDETPTSYLVFFGGLYGLARRQAKRRGHELLSSLGLAEEHWKKPIGTLSKGMRRKVAIARCLLHEPAVVLFDEPTSGLDPFTAHELDDVVRRLRAEGKAILLSAHNLAQVEVLCDEIVILHNGRVVTRGTLAELRQQWGQQRYRVKATVAMPQSQPAGRVHEADYTSLGDVERALEVVRGADGIVLEVEAVPPRLEEILRKAAGT